MRRVDVRCSSLGDRLWDQLRDRLWDRLEDRLWLQRRDRLWDQLWGQISAFYRDLNT